MTEPREYTPEEIRDQFLNHMRHLVDYWSGEDVGTRSTKDRLDGLAFSFLSMIDGCSMAMPGFRIFPTCHPTDPDYLREHDENWYPVNDDSGDMRGEITTGYLHEIWYKND